MSLDRVYAWELTAPIDTKGITAALETLLPLGLGVIVLETTSFDPEVEKILRRYVIQAGIEIQAGILWPRSTMLHVGVTRESLDALDELVTTLPAPQVCDHLYAYSGNALILEWTDVFDDPIYLSASVPAASVARFCDTLGVAINRPPPAV